MGFVLRLTFARGEEGVFFLMFYGTCVRYEMECTAQKLVLQLESAQLILIFS